MLHEIWLMGLRAVQQLPTFLYYLGVAGGLLGLRLFVLNATAAKQSGNKEVVCVRVLLIICVFLLLILFFNLKRTVCEEYGVMFV